VPNSQYSQNDGETTTYPVARYRFTATTTRTISLRRSRSGQFSNLGSGGIFATVLISSFFVTRIACTLSVILLYGRHAYFVEGLHVADWKHSMLSNGDSLPWYGTLMIAPAVVPFCLAAVFAAEFLAKRLRSYLVQRPAWIGSIVRFSGGAALIALSFWFFSGPYSLHPIHPIPLSALVAGIVLVWRAIAGPFTRTNV